MVDVTYTVRAVPWEHGWELHIDGVGVTQSHTLDKAVAMVRDYLDIDGHEDAATAVIDLKIDIDDIQSAVDQVNGSIHMRPDPTQQG